MLARFFNDYEEIKDSTNKNRRNIKSDSADATGNDPPLLGTSERKPDVATMDEDSKVYASEPGSNSGETTEVKVKMEVSEDSKIYSPELGGNSRETTEVKVKMEVSEDSEVYGSELGGNGRATPED